ncbi:conserved hypothetical protein [Uncinocarpus reesii 1704]|uniref:Major facilitator superfamily (MFS) profile domain-containing protein n=1 Tax=Uncinocarpus reesii (strain UAMH 1704) TaxID=336963 RepID=C4JRX9_UNCRE|nr:uncharacterized protein UREG_05218 [Uncinocarpus reesii 1704]EEP80376.1 conserved hypothetical protein [Uncinocarpus reesii 1704]
MFQPRAAENADIGCSSMTTMLELQSTSRAAQSARSIESAHQSSLNDSALPAEELPPPLTATSIPHSWNFPRINIWRLFAANFSFIILGLNDAAYGALIPYLETYYNVSYTVISLIFLSPLVGYVTSALINNRIHMHFGQRGVAILSPGAHLTAYIIICLHPPFPVLVIAFILAGFGNGLADAAWNAWVGGMGNANELLGILHAFYGLGATLAPTVATSLIAKANWKWFEFYYLVVGAAFLEMIFLSAAFWTATAARYRAEHPPAATTEFDIAAHAPKKLDRVLSRVIGNGRTAEALKNKVTWICSIFISIYAGAEVGLGGWIVTFMINIRHGSAFASGMSATGFWLGLTVGRVILGFVTPRLFRSEKHAVIVYLLFTIALELLFWLVPQFYISAVMVSLLGFFLGPLFPIAIVAATKLLPKHIHVSAIGFAAAIGASGSTAFPFAVGAIAQERGVQILQPFILAILVACMGVWLFLPSLSKKNQ